MSAFKDEDLDCDDEELMRELAEIQALEASVKKATRHSGKSSPLRSDDSSKFRAVPVEGWVGQDSAETQRAWSYLRGL